MSSLRRLVALSFVSGCVVAGPTPPANAPGSYAPPPPMGPGGSAAIQIVAGTYGANCGQPRGNVTAHLAAACNGRDQCAYRVDFQAIGDPAYGCQKDYSAEWTCVGSPQIFRAVAAPEAGFGSVVEVGCATDGATVAGGAPPPAEPSPYQPPPPSYQPAPQPLPPPLRHPRFGAFPPPPPPMSHAIRVVAGSYGGNCRTPHGNATAHLHQSCEGRPDCAYRVDYKVIGDPAYGCGKDYVAEWTCDDDPTVRRAVAGPEAGYGSIVTLVCDGAPAGTGAVVAGPEREPHHHSGPPPGPIVIREGSYGPNCGAPRGNVTAHLAQACNGQWQCAYRVDYKVIGDPAYGCQKDYVAEWTCGQHEQLHRAVAPREAGFGSVLSLACP